MTACNAMQEDLGALLAGALEDGERARVEEHVEGCDFCKVT